MVGSEGTLVTVVEATVQLVPAPRHRVIAVGHFMSVQAAIEATEDALACQPAAVELLDRTIIELSRQKIEYASLGTILHGDPEALLFVTFFGDSQAEAVAGLGRLEESWRAHGHGYYTLRAVDATEQAALLKVREAGLGLLMAASTGTRRPLAFVEDTAVEPARLASYTDRFRQILDAHGLTAGFYGHCSVGCLHIRPFVDLSAPGQPELMRAVAEEVRDLVLEYGGVNSSEHGDGLARADAHHPAPLRRPRRDARCRRPLHEHRAMPQGVDRRHVPVVHGHPRGRTLDPGPRERPAARAVHA